MHLLVPSAELRLLKRAAHLVSGSRLILISVEIDAFNARLSGRVCNERPLMALEIRSSTKKNPSFDLRAVLSGNIFTIRSLKDG